jgi:ribose 5-phosphate isomerase B
MKNFKIALGADHAGFSVKSELMSFLAAEGFKVVDLGCHSDESADYPDFALRVAKAVASGRCDRGILLCGSGIGMAVAANKVAGVRAGVCWSVKVSKLASQHNWCNVACFPARFASLPHIKKMALMWLKTPFEKGGRHERRVKKIIKIESKF